ncbi:MAG TPA: hypothetical protein VN371_03570 [Chlorobaculum sp.]|nr:hypothetical protein [Chlorobaculum sp.]
MQKAVSYEAAFFIAVQRATLQLSFFNDGKDHDFFVAELVLGLCFVSQELVLAFGLWDYVSFFREPITGF